jgi:hypothetical protein
MVKKKFSWTNKLNKKHANNTFDKRKYIWRNNIILNLLKEILPDVHLNLSINKESTEGTRKRH